MYDSKTQEKMGSTSSSKSKTVKSRKKDDTPAWKRYYRTAILFWIPVSYVFLILQIVEIYTKKSATNVSFPGYLVYITSSVIWFIYGAFVLEKRNWPIIMSMCFAFTLALVLLIGIVIYKPADELFKF